MNLKVGSITSKSIVTTNTIFNLQVKKKKLPNDTGTLKINVLNLARWKQNT